jgi:hypothetical protein
MSALRSLSRSVAKSQGTFESATERKIRLHNEKAREEAEKQNAVQAPAAQ